MIKKTTETYKVQGAYRLSQDSLGGKKIQKKAEKKKKEKGL